MLILKVISVISEFNPFHKGHKFLLENIKSQFPNSKTVAIMSGNFVQRGDVAIVDKYTRAKMALDNGFDLVVELPVPYAVSSAEIFANAGAKIAYGLNTDILAFGAENKLEELNKIADLQNSDDFQTVLKSELSLGKSYPSALNNAVNSFAEFSNCENVLNGANNVLAIEYIKAIKQYNIEPFAVKRMAVSHDSEVTNSGFASASAIRKMLLENNNPSDYLTDKANFDDFENIASIKNLETALLFQLRNMSKEDFSKLPDVTEGLENRIYEAVRNYNSIEEILTAIKTKRYTMARLRRILIYALLGITKDLQKTPVPYIRVLGFNQNGIDIISNAKKSGKMPIITKVSAGINQLDDVSKAVLEKEIYASDIWTLAQNKPTKCGMDFYREIVKI